jgi:hypothetical protein
MGANLFARDDSNKSPVEIAVLVDGKLRRKKHTESEVLRYLKSSVLSPIQKMFFLEFGESTTSVTSVSELHSLTLEQLTERFPYHNNLQALHLFTMDSRLDELRYLQSRGVDMNAEDDDGNTALHFVASSEVARFIVEACCANVNARNKSDGYTPAHSVVTRAAMEELDETEAVAIIDFLVSCGADFGIKSDSEDLGVAELAVDMFDVGPIVDACARGRGALNGESLKAFRDELHAQQEADEEDDISVASHDDKVIGENGEESEDEEDSIPDEDEEDESSEEEDNEDFFIRRK